MHGERVAAENVAGIGVGQGRINCVHVCIQPHSCQIKAVSGASKARVGVVQFKFKDEPARNKVKRQPVVLIERAQTSGRRAASAFAGQQLLIGPGKVNINGMLFN